MYFLKGVLQIFSLYMLLRSSQLQLVVPSIRLLPNGTLIIIPPTPPTIADNGTLPEIPPPSTIDNGTFPGIPPPPTIDNGTLPEIPPPSINNNGTSIPEVQPPPPPPPMIINQTASPFPINNITSPTPSLIPTSPSTILLTPSLCDSEVSLNITSAICDTASCHQRCGRTDLVCSCDSLCIVYNDCCYDFVGECRQQYETGTMHLDRYRRSSSSNMADLPTIPLTPTFFDGFLRPTDAPQVECIFLRGLDRNMVMVTGCIHRLDACVVSKSDPASQILVTEVNSGVTFINLACALCNNVQPENILPWVSQLVCNQTDVISLFGQSARNVSSLEEIFTAEPLLFQRALREEKCRLDSFIPLNTVIPNHKCHSSVLNTCPSRCNNSDLVNLCERGPQLLSGIVAGSTFSDARNVFCGQCNELQVQCGVLFFVDDGNRDFLAKFNLQLLLNFNPQTGLQVGFAPERAPSCPVNTVWVSATGTCAPIVCPSTNTRLINGKCVNLINGNFLINFQFLINKKSLNLRNLTRVADVVINASMSLVNTYFANHSLNDFQSSLTPQNTNLTDVTALIMVTTFTYQVTESFFMNRTATQVNEDLSMIIYNNTFNILKSYYQVLNSSSLVRGTTMLPPITDSNCTMIILSSERFQILDNSHVQIISTGQIINITNSSLSANQLIICAETLQVAFQFDIAMGIVTIILMSISIILLAIRAVLQYFITLYHTVPGKLQFHLVLALLIAFVAFMISPVLGSVYALCYIVAVVQHVAFLASFGWMNAVAVNLALCFSATRKLRTVSRQKIVKVSFFLVWGVSALIGAITVAVDLSPTTVSDQFRPLFAQGLCFFNQRWALLLFFALPMLLSILSNLPFYIFSIQTLRKIRKTTNRASSESNNSDLIIYLRMFASMGFTWLFGFIAGGTNNPVMWYIFIILNASSGVYLFLASTMTKQIRRSFYSKSKSTINSTKLTNLQNTPQSTPQISRVKNDKLLSPLAKN